MKNDVFFKYCMAGDDEKSIFIRHFILEFILGFHIKKTTVLNPELLPDSVVEKKVILDILLKDEKGQFFNIEMQISGYSQNNLLRFQEFAFRMTSRQTEKGKDYTNLKTCYQIIFIDAISEYSDEFIRYFVLKDQHNIEYDRSSLINIIFLQMPVINRIVKEKGIENLNAFEQLCYLFKNGPDDDILKSKERLVELLMEKHEEIKDNVMWWTFADAIERGERAYEGNLKEKYDNGFKEGIKEGALKTLHNAIKLKYQIHADDLVYSLDIDEVTEALNLVLLCENYDDFEQKFLAHKG